MGTAPERQGSSRLSPCLDFEVAAPARLDAGNLRTGDEHRENRLTGRDQSFTV
jgi:hypothetical protein